MKILYDHLCFWQRFGGVPKYFVEILKRMDPESYMLTVKYSNNEYLKQLENYKYHQFLPNLNFRGKSIVEKEFGKLFSIPQILSGKFVIYHQTHYDTYAYKFLSTKIKKVTTIHDMNFWTIPQYYDKRVEIIKNEQIKSALLSDHIITISQNSKNDLCRYLNIPEEKISVIYHGIDQSLYRNKIQLLKDYYILFVGARNEYKNFKLLIQAFNKIEKKYSDLRIYVAGNKPTKEEIDYVEHYGIKHKVIFTQPSDDELLQLYKGAQVFVYPSLYEGFGLPILEAMACDCPVLLSDASCFPEIASSSALYFNPYDVNSLAFQLDSVLSDHNLRNSLIEKGKERVKLFSWEKSVEQHLQVYSSLL